MNLRSIVASLAIVSLVTLASQAQTTEFAEARFSQSDRSERIKSLFPEIDRVFRELAETEHLPGLAYGVVLDGQLVHRGALGYANLEENIPVGSDTAFRIASMTKSFVTLAIFNLRDAGKLSLDDPIAKYVPAFRKVQPPTKDSPPITIGHLMTMAGGLPEDNPWGDRQMAINKKALRDFVAGGLSFSNPPGEQYEYSNLGYVLLGQVISKASGVPFQKYINEKILKPLGMSQTRWEYTSYSREQLALGYRWEHERWSLEPILPDGEGAACGGLITTIDDFARYVAMHLDAWPARNEPEKGPVRRATLREMHHPVTFSSFSTNINPVVTFYGYGLGWSKDNRGKVGLGHSGGLPGYGSNYRFYPDYNLAVIAFANRTYTPAHRGVSKALDILFERGELRPREVSVSPILAERRRQVEQWITSWDTRLGDEIAAENFFLDRSREDWMKAARETFEKAGKINSVGRLKPVNQLRGSFPMMCENGTVNVWFTLTPEKEPKVQELRLTFDPKK
jgi:CubicO group peptidase (beta-lactamase class C family)